MSQNAERNSLIAKSPSETVVASTPPADPESKPTNRDILLKSQQYALPLALKMMMDSDIKQSNGLAITTALFAGVMISFAQILGNPTDKSLSWEAVRVFAWGSIITNLSATMLALLAISFCTDLSSNAQRKLLNDPLSWPYKVEIEGEVIPSELQLNRSALLTEFGMSKYYRWVEFGQLLWVVFGMLSTFLAVTAWIWVAQSALVSGLLMVPIVFGFAGLVVCLLGPLLTGQ